MPAILRPSTRTSLGHLILASRPVQAATTSAAATAPSAVSQRRPSRRAGPVGGEEQDRHQDRRTGRGGPRPSPRRPRPAVCSSARTTSPSLAATSGPRREVVGARDSVPDRDPPPDPPRRQFVLDLVGAEPLGRPAIGRRPGRGAARARSRSAECIELASRVAVGRLGRRRRARPCAVGTKSAAGVAGSEQGDVQATVARC